MTRTRARVTPETPETQECLPSSPFPPLGVGRRERPLGNDRERRESSGSSREWAGTEVGERPPLLPTLIPARAGHVAPPVQRKLGPGSSTISPFDSRTENAAENASPFMSIGSSEGRVVSRQPQRPHLDEKARVPRATNRAGATGAPTIDARHSVDRRSMPRATIALSARVPICDSGAFAVVRIYVGQAASEGNGGRGIGRSYP